MSRTVVLDILRWRSVWPRVIAAVGDDPYLFGSLDERTKCRIVLGATLAAAFERLRKS